MKKPKAPESPPVIQALPSVCFGRSKTLPSGEVLENVSLEASGVSSADAFILLEQTILLLRKHKLLAEGEVS